MPIDISPMTGRKGGMMPLIGTYLCNFDVWDDKPPKEDAMVLNSTCLTVGVLSWVT